MRHMRSLGIFGALVTAGALWTIPAHAQKAPDPDLQEVMIKTTLLTFNDANVTENYSVLHAKLSKQFREQFPPERLKQVFKPFVEQKIDIEQIASKSPIPGKPAEVDERGVLSLTGHFDIKPSNVFYDLGYVMSEGTWKPIKINVNVRPPEKK
ncbi:hypothetical protein [Pseudorhodoplanes sp.]|uniref:hypothetical protein n=1 Tax=Pseudorhodoplanes sp. TaxID=1934341 RepID=UPI002C3AB90F|nr:hypothetical protein [Pseudorhodoplanes sp.]HWV42370.1 hypothetical protein [Pseudorhodoplanes sp.]